MVFTNKTIKTSISHSEPLPLYLKWCACRLLSQAVHRFKEHVLENGDPKKQKKEFMYPLLKIISFGQVDQVMTGSKQEALKTLEMNNLA